MFDVTATTDDITQSGVLTAGATGSSFTASAAAANVTLNSQTNVLAGTVSLNTGAGGTAALKESGGIDLGTSTAGLFNVTATTGDITQSGVLTADTTGSSFTAKIGRASGRERG